MHVHTWESLSKLWLCVARLPVFDGAPKTMKAEYLGTWALGRWASAGAGTSVGLAARVCIDSRTIRAQRTMQQRAATWSGVEAPELGLTQRVANC